MGDAVSVAQNARCTVEELKEFVTLMGNNPVYVDTKNRYQKIQYYYPNRKYKPKVDSISDVKSHIYDYIRYHIIKTKVVDIKNLDNYTTIVHKAFKSSLKPSKKVNSKKFTDKIWSSQIHRDIKPDIVKSMVYYITKYNF